MPLLTSIRGNVFWRIELAANDLNYNQVGNPWRRNHLQSGDDVVDFFF